MRQDTATSDVIETPGETEAGTCWNKQDALQESEIKVAALPAHLGRNMQEQILLSRPQHVELCVSTRMYTHMLVRAWSPRDYMVSSSHDAFNMLRFNKMNRGENRG